MVRHETDDCLREVVDRREDVYQGENAQQKKLISIEIAALVQELFHFHAFKFESL